MNRAIDTLYGRKKGTNSSMYPHFLLEETEIICIFMQHWLVHMKIILMFNGRKSQMPLVLTYWLCAWEFGSPLQEFRICGILKGALYWLDEQSLKLVSGPLQKHKSYHIKGIIYLRV